MNTIVRDTATVNSATGINRATDWQRLLPFVQQAEYDIARTVLGVAMYELLVANIDANTVPPIQQELIKLLVPMISGFALSGFAGLFNIQMSGMGFVEVSGEKVTPASQWKYNEAKVTLFRMGDKYREFVYYFLQKNHQDNDLQAWASSPAYTFYNELLIRNNSDLNQVIGKGENVNTFLTLLPFIRMAQEKYISPLLCADFLDTLLEKIKDDETTLTLYEAKVVAYSKCILAWFALYEALPSLKAVIIEGVMVTSLPSETSKSSFVSGILTQQERAEIRTDAATKAADYLLLLKAYLKGNALNLPNYTSTNCYQNTLTSSDSFKGFNGTNNSAGFFF